MHSAARFAPRPATPLLDGLQELVQLDAGASQQRPQGSTRHLAMIRHRERRDVSRLDEDDVAPSLPGHLPAEPDEGLRDLPSREKRQLLRQTEMSTWWTATVRGIPFSARTSRHSRIASSMFFRASLAVTPWLTHPGIAGHSATKTPSSSRSTVTTNFIRRILRRSGFVCGRFSEVALHAESLYRGIRELRKVVELNRIELSTS